MSTYLELSKPAQEQIHATIEQGQELALAGVQAWAASVSSLTNGLNLPAPADTPAPKELVANSFGFAEKLLKTQKTFAEKVVAASAPVLAGTAPTSK